VELFKAVGELFDEDGGFLSPEFHASDVQVGHTYFLAKDEAQLARKFAYQVYPILVEYVKDGVLRAKSDGELPKIAELDVAINGEKRQEDVLTAVRRWLGLSDEN